MTAAAPQFAEQAAPADWQAVDLIADLHLHPDHAATFDAWRRYMRDTPAQAIFILGDLFEVWVGDDGAGRPGFAAQCADVLRDAAASRKVHFMHGNRDFLVGDALCNACGMVLLADPTILSFAGRRWLLSHGDALCLSDVDYQRFRGEVRTARWKADFLAKPWAERERIARGLRDASEQRKRSAMSYADVDTAMAREWLLGARAKTLIHGHTHLPREHELGDGLSRIVLSDWDAEAVPPRGEVLRLDASGALRVPVV